jgi:hypothetical protein
MVPKEKYGKRRGKITPWKEDEKISLEIYPEQNGVRI